VEISAAEQTVIFFQAILLGVIYGLFYEGFRLWRLLFKSKAVAVFLQDIIFFVLCAIDAYSFMLAKSSGQVRGYILLGITLGFVAYYSTIAGPVFLALKWIARVVERVKKALANRIIRPIGVLFRKIFKKAAQTAKKNQKKWKEKQKNSKKHLQPRNCVEYNQSVSPKKKGRPKRR